LPVVRGTGDTVVALVQEYENLTAKSIMVYKNSLRYILKRTFSFNFFQL